MARFLSRKKIYFTHLNKQWAKEICRRIVGFKVYSQTCVQPTTQRSSVCWQVVVVQTFLCSLDMENGTHRQVVITRRWSLAQVWLYTTLSLILAMNWRNLFTKYRFWRIPHSTIMRRTTKVMKSWNFQFEIQSNSAITNSSGPVTSVR